MDREIKPTPRESIKKCEGLYTYGNIGGPRSAIDHVLVNNTLTEHFKGMHIDENRE